MPSKKQHLNTTEDNTPKPVPKEAREMSAFFSLLVEETMKTMPSTLTSTWVRCFRKGCTGIISTKVDLDNNELYWKCSKCKYGGTLTGF